MLLGGRLLFKSRARHLTFNVFPGVKLSIFRTIRFQCRCMPVRVHFNFAAPVFLYFSASKGCFIFGFSFDAHRLRVPSPVNAPIASVTLPHRL